MLLSRFDLVFVLLDQADSRMDDLLTAHIQALHSNGGKYRAHNHQSIGTSNLSNTLPTNAPLLDRLTIEIVHQSHKS